MKHIALLVLFGLCVPAAWAAKTVSVSELKTVLATLRDAKKSDSEIATRLKDVQLSEQLTPAARILLQEYAPGPLATEQLDILEGRTAVLPPPTSELPSAPPPDIASQKAIISKAIEYVTGVYMHAPHVLAQRSTTRYQDGVESIHTNSGMTNNMANTARSWELPNMYMRLIGSHTSTVEMDKGLEMVRPETQKQPWGTNGQISEGGPGPVLSVILQEAASAGTLQWKRWEMVRGHKTGVFAFAVPKKKSHYDVHYCCFPEIKDFGRMGYEGTGANLQYGTTWKDFKATVGYHGELFIDPETGAIERLATQAELKPSDFVHQEDMRIDYGPVHVGDREYILPLDSFTITEVVPNGDSPGARYSVRHTLFHMTYSEYRPAS